MEGFGVLLRVLSLQIQNAWRHADAVEVLLAYPIRIHGEARSNIPVFAFESIWLTRYRRVQAPAPALFLLMVNCRSISLPFKQCPHKVFGIKVIQVIGAFAQTDKAHWQIQIIGNGNDHTAFGRAVEFG